MKNYPRILIVNGQSMRKENATGITLRSILGHWPNDCLMEVYMGDEDILYSYGILSWFPIQNYIMKKYNSERIKTEFNITSENRGLKSFIKQRIKKICISISDMTMLRVPQSGWEKIDGFKPDIIYTLGASISVMKVANRASERYHIPIMIHFMDDWSHFLQDEKGIVQKIYKMKLQKWLKKTYTHSKICLAISPKMSEEYQNETGIKHIPMMNSVDLKTYYCKEKESTNTIIFTYAGGLHLDRWKAINDIIEELKKIDSKNQICVRIYTKAGDIQKYQKYFDEKIVEFYEYVSHEKVREVYQTTDVLIHAETNNPLLRGYFRYSISTKIPEYLASNRTLLFYGPKDIALYSYLKDNNVAYVANDKEELKQQLEKILCGKDINRKLMRHNGIELVKRNHELKRSRDVFYDAVIDSIQNNI